MSKKERQAEWVWHMQPSYRRLSRHDQTGLIWLLQGRPVVALTEAAAAIQRLDRRHHHLPQAQQARARPPPQLIELRTRG
jgi:hypothetical protein